MAIIPGAGCAARNDSASGAQVIDGSLRFLQGLQDQNFGTYLKRTLATDGNRRTYTISVWCKREILSGMSLGNGYTVATFDLAGANDFRIEFESSRADALNLYDATMSMDITTNPVYRDVAEWYHIVAVVDTIQGTNTNRTKIYVNGEQVTSLATATYPAQNAEGDWNDASYDQYLGQRGTGSIFAGYMSQYYFVDGQALAPTEFGYTDPLTNVWRPKTYDIKTAISKNLNKGVNWAGQVSISGSWDGPHDQDRMFDGSAATRAEPADGALVTWTPASPITGRLRMLMASGAYSGGADGNFDVKIDGTSYWTTIGGTPVNTTAWRDFGEVTINTNFTFGRDPSGGSNGKFIQVKLVEVDGYVLVTNTVDNSFYLPFDGNSLIGKDKSGNGNDWTPINFNGSVSLDKATGGLPILNTVSGGKVASAGVRTDSNYSSCLLALPLIGNTSDYSNQINSGSTTKTATASGASASVAGEQNLYSGSYKFDGSNDEIVISSTDFSPGTGPFTIECWFNQSVSGEQRILTSGNNTNSNQKSHYQMVVKSDRKVEINYDTTAGHVIASAAGLVNINQWHHFAMTRDSSSPPKMSIWLDGKEVASGTSNTGFNSNNTEGIVIGRESTGSSWWNGYISDVRYYNAVCKYTSDFLVGATNPDILPETSSGVAYSSKLTKPTAGSVVLDGSDECLTITSSSDLAFGTGDFTIELWVYYVADSTAVFFDMRPAPASTQGLYPVIYGGGGSAFTYFVDSSARITGTNPILNKWTHIAVSRSGTSTKMFVDGIQVGSTYSDSNNYLNGDTTIGANADGTNNELNGFISNVRVVKGTAVYTSAFTPSTSPLTNITNTKLLCAQSKTSPSSAGVSPQGNNTVGYSAYLSGGLVPGSANQYVPSNCFDGDITTTHVRHKTTVGEKGYAGWYFNPPTGIAYNTLEIHTGVSGVGTQEYVLNGGSATGFAENSWVQIDGSAGTLTALQITAGSTGNNNIYLGGIRINGSTILTDPVYNAGTGAVIPDSQPSTFNPFDTDIDTVMGKPTGYCTLNPLWSNSTQANGNNPPAFRNGNLDAYYQPGTPAGDYFKSALGTIGVDSTKGGKWYFETTSGGGQYCQIGMVRDDYQYMVGKDGWGLAGSTRGLAYQSGGSFSIDKGTVQSSLTTWTTYGQLASFLIDFDNKKVNAWVDGVDVGYTVDITSYLSDLSPIWYPAISLGDWSSLTDDETMHVNFGQKPFKFTPPEGFNTICASNLPSPGFVRPDKYYGTSLYTGNGGTQVVNQLDFQPDLVWIKQRSNGTKHRIYDSVRGVNSALISDETNAADQYAVYGQLASFNRNGFTVASGSSNAEGTNETSQTIVAWSWKAGGNKNTFNIDDVGYSTAAAAGMDGGDITPTGCSVGTKQGFSILKYSGNGSNAQAINHGLGAIPDFVICKNLGTSYNWFIWHSAFGNNENAAIYFTNAAKTTGFGTQPFGTFTDTNLVFNGVNDGVCGNYDYICYAWKNIPGVQKFGQYNANNSTNGPYVELGFKPAYVCIKSMTTGGSARNWALVDSTRSYANVANHTLAWNLSNAESGFGGGESVFGASNMIDLLSDGFKIRDTGNWCNESGATYIYMAWAEQPLHNLYGAQSNAR